MNKQDEEKAKVRELARKHQGTMTDAQYLQMTYALEEMAAWKEQQMIEKAIEIFHKDSRWDYIFEVYPELIEDFKKYMEEN